ncbi:alpha-amylase [Flavonifractor sp. An112]|uniref:glycoside hydrolase family 13 protein n=1 Tax=Flavonifractor sp. An112 TaxID=1965544 RepID=UPI000B399E4C|nr:glycoside hydrolase family 13 protein [Flavonifractor sp. An112]OUQ57212.1 alpha-amylase [Flavonifractor sp. An112]
MLDAMTFDSRDSRYKQPYGAVPSGTQVSLTLRPLRTEGFSQAVLIAYFESSQERRLELPMAWDGIDGDRDVLKVILDTGDHVGLIWYSFRLEGLDGRQEELGPYQLTVYDGTDQVPGWFGEGVTYQIFPDRFRRTRVPDPTGMPGGRTVHTSWREEPEYRPDQNGEVRNRDFFGGDLKGVMEKLPYLHDLGVETIYFCPIFEAPENHRYGTGDYEKIDPMLGTEEDFKALCGAAHKLGMKIMLDGVFNHQGYVSRYFNGDGSYPENGACQSQDSPYYKWYHFSHWPDKYDSWWGIYSLPAVNEGEPSYRDYIFGDENSIVRRWLRAGADAWRLDVADELPDDFVHGIHQAVRETNPEAVVIGEVWEDGSTKIAYGVRRKHILGGHCDGLMNYPFRNSLLGYLMGGDAVHFKNTMEAIRENYPPFAFHSAMNFLGTHDTPRILTLLGYGGDGQDHDKDWRSSYFLTPEQYLLGRSKLMLGALVLFAFPGSPMIYYGDEAGIEGFEDPFNRRTYRWEMADDVLRRWYASLGKARRELPALRRGSIRWWKAEGKLLSFLREGEGQPVLTAVNIGKAPELITLPWAAKDWMTGMELPAGQVALPPMTGWLLTPYRPGTR